MGDIEKKFYQVKVLENHRSLLCFLWWPEDDFDLSPIDHEMRARVFGASSSPGCSNYALKRTSIDYCKEFGEDVSSTLKKNFYVDDLLKSVRSVSEAIKLISQVTIMCRKGGFNLTQFVSNNKMVFDAIPEELRRKRISSWLKIKRIIAYVLKFIKLLKNLYNGQGR